MAGPKTCERCGAVSFSRAHDLTRHGWVLHAIAGTNAIWTCARCQQDCGCSHCRAREWQQQDQPPPLQEAMSDADLDEHESYMAEIAAQERNTDG